MRNEAVLTLNNYFGNRKDDKIYYWGADTDLRIFSDLFLNGQMIVGDFPDMVIMKDNIAIMIEHFEFDCFKRTRKGSTNRKEQARIDHEFERLPATEKGTIHHDTIKGQSSYQDYLSNAHKNFCEHYVKVSDYKQRLISEGIIKENMVVKMMFLIDDVSPIGTMAVDYSETDPQIVPIVLAQSPEFLQLFEESQDIDYVLCCSSAVSSRYIWFIARNNIKEYLKNACDYKNMGFLDSSPHVTSAKILIPKNRIIEHKNNEES